MRWPWTPSRSGQRLLLRRIGDQHAFVLTDGAPGHPGEDRPARLLRWGLLPEARPVPAGDAIALLDPADYQILKVDTPNVPQEELKSAARWQIKEMVDVDVAELTLDVMHVGGDVERAKRELFVIAARNSAIKTLTDGAAAISDHIAVVDVWETALRNLLAAQARVDDLAARACAAVHIDERHCLLVVCAGDELFYTRRLEGDPGLLARARGEQAEAGPAELPLGFEYQPGGTFDASTTQESPLVVELQRSIDVWEAQLARTAAGAPVCRHGRAWCRGRDADPARTRPAHRGPGRAGRICAHAARSRRRPHPRHERLPAPAGGCPAHGDEKIVMPPRSLRLLPPEGASVPFGRPGGHC